MLDSPAIRRQFPVLGQTVDGHPLIYLDNAATVQKPRVVLEAMDRFYREDNANAHRGMYPLAERATVAYENARATVARFLGATHPGDIIFTKSCTESLNIVARCFAAAHLQPGNAVIVTMLEHHSNIVPWLQLKDEKGIELRWVDINDDGTLKMEQLEGHLRDGKVKLVSVTGQSNVLGIRPDLPAIIRRAHDAGALVCIDAAQLAGHHAIDVATLDCDFLAFSGHKLYAPLGIGVLYGKSAHLRAMKPWLGGGMMIKEVFTDHYTAADVPAKFEGGTPPIAEAVGLSAAIEWMSQFSWADIEKHEQLLIDCAAETLTSIPGLALLGSRNQSGCLSFTLDNLHPHDVTHLLGERGICLRAGHHCAQPLHRRLGIPASTRLSVALYNTTEEIDAIAPAIREIQKKFRS